MITRPKRVLAIIGCFSWIRNFFPAFITTASKEASVEIIKQNDMKWFETLQVVIKQSTNAAKKTKKLIPIKYQKRTIILVNTNDITSELLGIKKMGSLRLLYNRYNSISSIWW